MHELGITEQLLELTLRHAEEAGAERVTRLNLVIGEFSSVVDESIQFYWDMLAEDTLAAGAELHFTRVPGQFHCAGCGADFGLAEFEGRCPACGGVAVSVADGKQFQLESIEVEGPGVHVPQPES
jgi:hydrogenase nickel incorporation protein HypA/HybF